MLGRLLSFPFGMVIFQGLYMLNFQGVNSSLLIFHLPAPLAPSASLHQPQRSNRPRWIPHSQAPPNHPCRLWFQKKRLHQVTKCSTSHYRKFLQIFRCYKKMLEEQHPLYKEKLYFDLVGMHWIPDKKCVFVVAFHFHPFWTPSVHGFRPPSSFTKPRMLNAFVTWEDTLRGWGWCFLQTSTVWKTHLPSQFWGAVERGKIGSQFRFNDELNLASEKWSIGKNESMKNRGISWSKSLAFILQQNAPQPRNPLRLEKIPPGTPNFEGDESYGVFVAIFWTRLFHRKFQNNIHSIC